MVTLIHKELLITDGKGAY